MNASISNNHLSVYLKIGTMLYIYMNTNMDYKGLPKTKIQIFINLPCLLLKKIKLSVYVTSTTMLLPYIDAREKSSSLG